MVKMFYDSRWANIFKLLKNQLLSGLVFFLSANDQKGNNMQFWKPVLEPTSLLHKKNQIFLFHIVTVVVYRHIGRVHSLYTESLHKIFPALLLLSLVCLFAME